MGAFDNLLVHTGEVITAEKWNSLVAVLEEHELKIPDFKDGPLRIETERLEQENVIKYRVYIANGKVEEGSGNGQDGGPEIKIDSSLNFGEDTRQMINLWGEEYGIGVQSNTTYFRSYHGFTWFNRGKHHDDQHHPGEGGDTLMVLDESGLTSRRNAGALKLEGNDHVYIEFYPRAKSSGRKAWMGFGGAGTRELRIHNEDGGNIVLSGGGDIMLRPGDNRKVDVGGNMQIGGTLEVGGEKPILFKTFSFKNSNNSLVEHNTGISFWTYHAAIVGFSTGAADIDEGGRDATFFYLRMVARGPKMAQTWHIKADLKTYNNHAEWMVDVMFVRKEIFQR